MIITDCDDGKPSLVTVSLESRVKSYLEIEDRFYVLMMLFNLELFLIGGRYLKFNDYIGYGRLIC